MLTDDLLLLEQQMKTCANKGKNGTTATDHHRRNGYETRRLKDEANSTSRYADCTCNVCQFLPAKKKRRKKKKGKLVANSMEFRS